MIRLERDHKPCVDFRAERSSNYNAKSVLTSFIRIARTGSPVMTGANIYKDTKYVRGELEKNWFFAMKS
jgi:hypothetical protein